jgi:hypothetical protein
MWLHCDEFKFYSYMWLLFVSISSLNEKIDEKWSYVIHYQWYPLMVDIQIFATIQKWLNDMW